jgi:hypothetical protein
MLSALVDYELCKRLIQALTNIFQSSDMIYFTAFHVVLLCYFSLAHGHQKHCLKDADATSLANRWLEMNAKLDTSIAASLVTENFTLEDETINFGVGTCVLPPEGPYVFNKAGLITNLGIRVGEAIVLNQSYTPLLIVHDCEHISIRWQGQGFTKGNVVEQVSFLIELTGHKAYICQYCITRRVSEVERNRCAHG